MTEQRPATGMRSQLQELIAALTAERDQLREQLKEERLTSADEARKRDEHFAENKQLRTALREMREALFDVKELATTAAVCEVEAAISLEPGSDVFGASGIAKKSYVARAKSAWKAMDDHINVILARHAGLVEEAKETQ